MTLRLLTLLAIATLCWADSSKSELSTDEVVERYLAAAQSQQAYLRGAKMEVDIEAKLPKLKKEGRLHALRLISRLGQIAYKQIQFIGDNTIKKDVIARYLTAETENNGDRPNMGINGQNYKFKYKGMSDKDGREVHVLQLSPRRKSVGLFKGELWLDTNTFQTVREQGEFVKSPSLVIRKIGFIRDYEIVDGRAIPVHIDSTIDTRLVGKAEISIKFTNFSREQETEEISYLPVRDTQ